VSDVIYAAVSVLFFTICVLYTVACDRL